MLDAIDPTDSAVWFAIYVLIGTVVMSEGLVREWASTDGTFRDVFDLNKAAPTLALGAVGGAVVFGIGGPIDPGLFEVAIGALIPILDNLRSVVRAVSGAVNDEQEAGGDAVDQAIAGGRAARDEFDKETWDESRRQIEEGLEDADGPTPTAATDVHREIRKRFDDAFGVTIPSAGIEPTPNDTGPEPANINTDDNAPTPIGEAEDEAHYGSKDGAGADSEADTTTDNDDVLAPIGEAEDEALRDDERRGVLRAHTDDADDDGQTPNRDEEHYVGDGDGDNDGKESVITDRP